MLFNEINTAVKFAKDYSSIILEAKREVIEQTGLKIVTPKQILQILPIALAQVKYNFRQVVYSVYQSKEITEKVYSNLIKN